MVKFPHVPPGWHKYITEYMWRKKEKELFKLFDSEIEGLDKEKISAIIEKYKPTLGDFEFYPKKEDHLDENPSLSLRIEHTGKRSRLPKDNEEAKYILSLEFFIQIYNLDIKQFIEEGGYFHIIQFAKVIKFIKPGSIQSGSKLGLALPRFKRHNFTKRMRRFPKDERIKLKFLKYLNRIEEENEKEFKEEWRKKYSNAYKKNLEVLRRLKQEQLKTPPSNEISQVKADYRSLIKESEIHPGLLPKPPPSIKILNSIEKKPVILNRELEENIVKKPIEKSSQSLPFNEIPQFKFKNTSLTKKCPYCGELIALGVTICPYCWKELD